MTEFGQGLTPTTYLNQSARRMTKTELVHEICLALYHLGMEPITAAWGYDAFDDNLIQDVPMNELHLFPFYFPDTSTFSIDGVNYRPIIVVLVYPHTAEPSNANTTYDTNSVVGVQMAYVREGAFDYQNVWTIRRIEANRQNTTPSYATERYNLWQDDINTSNPRPTHFFEGQLGAYHLQKYWANRPSDVVGTVPSQNNPARIAIGHVFMHLGPAGLVVQIGSTTTSRNDRISAFFAFHGARIPDRALPEVEDVNLNRINPVARMSLRGDTEQYNQGYYRYRHLGLQYGLNTRQERVWMRVYNLLNRDRVFPVSFPNTAPSPRRVAGGFGAHILADPYFVPTHDVDDANNHYSQLETALDPNFVQPEWSDVYYGSAIRWCDKTAPLGEFEDPNTGLNWYIIENENVPCRMGILYEGATEFDTFPAISPVQIEDFHYNMTNGEGGAYPTSVTWDGWASDNTVPSSGSTDNVHYWTVGLDSSDLMQSAPYLEDWDGSATSLNNRNSVRNRINMEIRVPDDPVGVSAFFREVYFEYRMWGQQNTSSHELRIYAWYQYRTNSRTLVDIRSDSPDDTAVWNTSNSRALLTSGLANPTYVLSFEHWMDRPQVAWTPVAQVRNIRIRTSQYL